MIKSLFALSFVASLLITSCGPPMNVRQSEVTLPPPPATEVMVLASTSNPTVTKETRGWLSFTHSRGLFSISYPFDWQAHERDDGIEIIAPDGKASVSVYVKNSAPSKARENLTDFVRKFLQDTFGGEQSFNLLRISEKGTEQRMAEFSFVDTNFGSTLAIGRFDLSGELIFLTLALAADKTWADKGAALQEVLNSMTPGKGPFTIEATPQNASWKVFGDYSETYLFLYPDDWKAKEEGGVVQAISPDGFFRLEMRTIAEANPEGYIEEWLKNMSQKYPGLKSFEVETVMVSGVNGKMMEYAYVDESRKAIAETLIVVGIPMRHGELVMRFSSDFQEHEKGLNYFELLLDGFRWVDYSVK